MALGTTLLLLQLSMVAPADAQALRDARAAQQRFELTRRWNLPRGAGRSSRRCDATVGRYCYWYDSTGTTPPPDAPIVVAARDDLLVALEIAARTAPHNDWVAGQRVRYLVEAGRLDDAHRAAKDCAADRWWCSALEGLALHVGQRYVEAESAFAHAIASMTDRRRCEWFDLSDLTTGTLSKQFRRATCDQRRALAERFWQLSKPLWSTPGNDVATEHFARHTMAEILTGSANGYGTRFGDDNRELVLRYGWVEWYTQHEPSLYHSSAPEIVGHDREPSYSFAPDVASLDGDARMARDPWWLRNPAAITRYAPRHVKWLGELRHQLTRFPRGDSMLVVAAYQVTDPALGRDTTVAVVTFADGTGTRVAASGSAQPIAGMLGRDTTIIGIEVTGKASQRSERARYTVDPLPCSRWCLSDLLLFAAGDTMQDVPLDVAMRTAIPDRPAPATTPLGVYWEVMGVGTTPLELSLTIEPVDVSRMRRAAARLRLASQPTTVRLHWVEVPDSTSASHGLSIRLPASARGRVRVALTVAPKGLTAQTATREIEIVR